MKKRAAYTKEFKLEALRLMAETSRPASEIARELGVRRNQLYKWQEEFKAKGDLAFRGQGRPKKQSKVSSAVFSKRITGSRRRTRS